MRQLASIQRITAINPIEGADNIEVCSVLGWQVVAKKGEHQVGDLAVYLEIDSVPPDEPMYQFLWKFADKRPNNFRIKTIKLRGQLSQGILFAAARLDEDRVWIDGTLGQERGAIRCEGDDVTNLLGVTKYEPPLPNGGTNIEGQFFDGVTKTDEERVQSAEGAKRLQRLRGRPYYITEKLDGSSMTVAMHEDIAKVASRNYRLANIEGSAYWNAAVNSGVLPWVAQNLDYAVQGELVGPGIQNNRLGLSQHEFRVFNIYDRMGARFLSLAEMIETGLPLVPVIEVGYLFNYDQEQLLRLAEGKYAGTKNEREGIVIRSNDGDRDRVSFKAISNKFLLSGGN